MNNNNIYWYYFAKQRLVLIKNHEYHFDVSFKENVN